MTQASATLITPSPLGESEPHPSQDPTFRETHQIHTSENRSFRGCRRRWDFAYRQGYVLDQAPRPLELGIAFHIGMQAFYDPETWDTTTKEEKASAAIRAYVDECERQRANFIANTRQERVMEASGDDYTERIELGIGMLEHYAYYIHPQQDNWFRPVMVEVPFKVPIELPGHPGLNLLCFKPGTQPGRCGQNHAVGAQVTFDGRVDMIIEDIYNGGYFIWDHKTAAQIQQTEDYLHLDDQVGGYSWALRTVLGIDIRGFVYAEYRKDYPKPPALLKRQVKGRSFSTNKQQPTDLAIFRETVERYDSAAYQAGEYAEYIEWLSSKEAPVFHKRFTILKTPYELDQIGYNLSLQAREMLSTDLAIYPSPGKFTCSGCAYYSPCRGMNAGEDIEYTLDSMYKKVK
jgi:hypothetical protein